MKYIKNISVLILIFAWSNSYAFDSSVVGSKSQNEGILEAIQRDESLWPYFTYESSISNFANKIQCIRINHSLHKGGRQRSDRPFKWVIDVPIGGEISPKMKADIVKLDALVAVEMLEKKHVTIKIDSKLQSFNRYRLTVKGWAGSTGSNKRKLCFYLGKAKHLSVIDVKKIEIPIGRGEKENVYQVIVQVGFPKGLKLPGWANDPEVRRAFPLIDKLVSGYERKILMEKKEGQWREYLSPSHFARMKKSGKGLGRSESYFTKNEPSTKRETMLEEFRFKEHRNRTWSCISLPGESSNGLKVDKKFDSGTKYSVAIYDNKVRSKWDHIETTTKPYLERLVVAGILASNREIGIKGEKKSVGKLFSGTVYRLVPEYQHIFDPKRGCIFLGKGKVNIVDLEIFVSNIRDNFLGEVYVTQREYVTYKYIMTFPNPPEWAKDRVLQAWWSDLKGALKYGLACEGKFAIDLARERKMGVGSGSCWWAYDSVAKL